MRQSKLFSEIRPHLIKCLGSDLVSQNEEIYLPQQEKKLAQISANSIPSHFLHYILGFFCLLNTNRHFKQHNSHF
jgi:hypothetical protein